MKKHVSKIAISKNSSIKFLEKFPPNRNKVTFDYDVKKFQKKDKYYD